MYRNHLTLCENRAEIAIVDCMLVDAMACMDTWLVKMKLDVCVHVLRITVLTTRPRYKYQRLWPNGKNRDLQQCACMSASQMTQIGQAAQACDVSTRVRLFRVVDMVNCFELVRDSVWHSRAVRCA